MSKIIDFFFDLDNKEEREQLEFYKKVGKIWLPIIAIVYLIWLLV
jgi:hypothetical protein